MKKGKKIVIGVAAVAVVAGGIYAASGAGRGGSQIPQVTVTKAETGDVEEIVDATGTVVSDEQKTFYSPVNAQIRISRKHDIREYNIEFIKNVATPPDPHACI